MRPCVESEPDFTHQLGAQSYDPAGAGKIRQPKVGDYFLAFCALNFFHRAFIIAEILALAAALSLRFFFGAPFFVAEARWPTIRSSCCCKDSIFCRTATARFNCCSDNLTKGLFVMPMQ